MRKVWKEKFSFKRQSTSNKDLNLALITDIYDSVNDI